MQFVSEWATADRRRLVILSDQVTQVLMRYRQRFPWQTEAGGILLGRRRGNHIEVVEATEPTRLDRRAPYLWEREVSGHAQAATGAWRLAAGTVDYVGEWHTHPQRVPTPSSLDRREWHKLAQARPKTSLVAVVVGTRNLHLELVSVAGQLALVPLA
jgi:integrative and conjugative element protein (TIGR02256 family)